MNAQVRNFVKASGLRLKQLSWKVKLMVAVPPVLLIAYLIMACAVFDFSKAAFPFQQGTSADGRPMAIGPRPRPWAYRADKNWEGMYWKGNEWPFVVFAPVCSYWRHSHGYAPPEG